jgi:hypothetical protein
MPLARSIQVGGLAAVLDGLLWILRAGVGLSDPAYWNPSSGTDYLAVALYSAALLGLLPALLVLHTQQRGRSGRLGRWAFGAAFIGAAAAGIGNLAEDWFRLGLVGLVLYLPGILLLTGGLLLLGVATVRANVFPRWCGWALLVGLLGLVLIERGGGLVLGLVWIALGSLLLAAKGRNGRTGAGPPRPQPWPADKSRSDRPG